MNGCAPGLALIERFKGTRKWAIFGQNAHDSDTVPSSNQKGAISKTVYGWHVRISLRITVARKLSDFDFLRGPAPGRLDGFSIGRYEKNRGSFDLYAAKFESGAVRFLG